MPRLVYIAHKYSDNPEANIASVRAICWNIAQRFPNVAPIAPHLLFPAFLSEGIVGRQRAMELCLTLAKRCDELWVCCCDISAGMWEEITTCSRIGIAVVPMFDKVK